MKFEKKAFVISSLVFFCCVELFALKPFQIDFNIEYGMLKGEVNEYVLYAPSTGQNYTESRLDWDLDFVSFFGASIDLVFIEHIYLGVAGRFGIQGASGSMQDYDWLNVEVGGKSSSWYDNHYWITNYSKHENFLTKYLDGSVKIGGIINLPCKIFLLPSVSLQGQEFAFDGKNGYSQYSNGGKPNSAGYYDPWNEEIPKNGFSGNVISYNQQRMFVYLGLKVYTTIVPRFCFSLEGNLGLYTGITAVDNHWLRKIEFLDKPSGFGSWSVAGRVQFSFNKLCRLALNVDYQYVPVLTGVNYWKSSSSSQWNKNPLYLGGASSSILSFSFMATLWF